MQNKYNDFYNLVNGKFIETEDASNYAQCMDLAFKWLDFLNIPRDTIRHLYAYQVWTNPFDSTRLYFDLIPNTVTNVPQVGDIPVFGQLVGVAGHISIAAPGSNSNDLVSLDQNWGYPKSTRLVTHTKYTGVLGWLHPKMVETPVTIQEVHDIVWSSDNNDNKMYKLQQLIKQ